ncbi:hypothetical protein [Asanoa ishikariensis]|nr:hypothetical protein [Asanoa ishikariensis]
MHQLLRRCSLDNAVATEHVPNRELTCALYDQRRLVDVVKLLERGNPDD